MYEKKTFKILRGADNKYARENLGKDMNRAILPYTAHKPFVALF